jgi:hypothetical protein
MEQVEYSVALSDPRALFFSYVPDVADFPVPLMYGAFARSGSTPVIRSARTCTLARTCYRRLQEVVCAHRGRLRIVGKDGPSRWDESGLTQ